MRAPRASMTVANSGAAASRSLYSVKETRSPLPISCSPGAATAHFLTYSQSASLEYLQGGLSHSSCAPFNLLSAERRLLLKRLGSCNEKQLRRSFWTSASYIKEHFSMHLPHMGFVVIWASASGILQVAFCKWQQKKLLSSPELSTHRRTVEAQRL